MKQIVIWIVVIAIIGLAGYFGYDYYQKKNEAAAPQQSQTENMTDGVQGQEVKIGTGKLAESGSIVTVEYVGKLADGTVFDSSKIQGKPLVFTLGAPGIIPGFQIGVNGMREGGERLMAIPPSLGYGDQQMGIILPNSTIIFEVKLIKVEAGQATGTPANNN